MPKTELDHRTLPMQGLNLARSPFTRDETMGGPPEQQQQWPGSDEKMLPLADHGERSYRGGDKLLGMKALITGGDSGIGRAVAIAFAREGADIAISYLDEHEDAKRTIEWIAEAGRRAFSLAGDIRDRMHCREFVRRSAEALGGVNILVNNAAFHGETRDLDDITPEQLDRTVQTNLAALIWTTQAAVPMMGEGDVIINTGSVAGLQSHPSLIDYSATKAAVHTFTRSLAVMLAPRGIRSNCVAPGPVWTPLIASTRSKEHVGEFGSKTLWNRPAQPAEIAPCYVFLASADARFITGETLSPSGIPTTTR